MAAVGLRGDRGELGTLPAFLCAFNRLPSLSFAALQVFPKSSGQPFLTCLVFFRHSNHLATFCAG